MLNTAPPSLAGQFISDFRRFGERQCVVDIDPEISNRVFNLGVPEQYLNSAKVACRLVDQGGFGAPKRMCSVVLRAQSNGRYPLIDQPRILSGA